MSDEPQEQTPTTPPPPAAGPTPPPPHVQKNPIAAAFLAVMPGLGHVYNGLYQRGVVFFILFFGAITLAAEEHVVIFVFASIFLWFFNILDAYRQAKLINHGYATDLGLRDSPARSRPGLGALWAGIVLLTIGVLEVMERFDLWRWEYMRHVWPAGFIVAGGWLIASYLRNRQAESL